jgi:hypothetical protein
LSVGISENFLENNLEDLALSVGVEFVFVGENSHDMTSDQSRGKPKSARDAV